MASHAIQRELTANIIANEVRMERAAKPGITAVLVEGGSDARLFKRFLSPAYVTLTLCLDREKLLRVLQLLEEAGFVGVIAIADADFDRILGAAPASANICWTDANDCETMILPTVFRKILDEYGTEDRIAADEQANGNALDFLIAQASQIGAVRFVNKRDSLGLKFSGMSHQFQSPTSILIDLNATIDHVLARSQTPLQAPELREMVEEALAAHGSQIEMCQGHDAIRILGRGLRRNWGSCANFDSGQKSPELEKIVRVAYELADFAASDLHACMTQWQVANTPYRLF
jgi:hypothetical protein